MVCFPDFVFEFLLGGGLASSSEEDESFAFCGDLCGWRDFGDLALSCGFGDLVVSCGLGDLVVSCGLGDV